MTHVVAVDPSLHAVESPTMPVAPLQFLLLVFAGWVNRRQVEVIEYLQEEKPRPSRATRRSSPALPPRPAQEVAAKGRAIGRRALEQLAGLVTPDTILRWYRELIARKYDGSSRRQGGCSGTADSLQRLVVQFATDNPSWG